MDQSMSTYHLSIKSGKKGTAANHAAYIAREGKHGKDEKGHDLVATGYGNLPEWANGNPAVFWEAADQHERANAAVYREFEVALPKELTTVQQCELAGAIIQHFIGDKPYQFAIHRPMAAIGKVPQTHLHAMVSDRLPDGIARPPHQHFSRFNRAHPDKGGARKDSGGMDRVVLRNEVVSQRETCAKLLNEYLEKYGHTERVDHRSHKERGIEALPEWHLGPARVRQMTHEEKEEFQERRKRA
jgi:hypothetical protein